MNPARIVGLLALGLAVVTGPAGPARAADMTLSQAGAHASHTQDNSAHAKLACAECHAPVCSATGTNLVFGPLAQAQGATPTWNAATRTCSNVYCHGDNSAPLAWSWQDVSVVKPRAVECAQCHGYPPAAPHPQSTDCRSCHNGTVLADGTIDRAGGKHLNGQVDFSGGASGSDCSACHGFAPATGAHAAHFALAGAAATGSYTDIWTLQDRFPSGGAPAGVYAFGCATCHSVNATNHLNGSTDVSLFEVAAPAGSLKARASAGAAYTRATGACSGTYCHGSTTAPAWTSGAKLACNGCHGTSTADGRPDYASGTPKANSHGLHSAYGCQTCHAGTTADGRTIASTSLHVNGAYDVSPGTGVSFTYAYAATGGTCSNISCHFGGNSTWGPTVSHQAALGVGDITVFDDQSGSNSDHGSLDMTEACTLCHSSSLITQHAGRCDLCHQGENPASKVAATWGTNNTCGQQACHATIHAPGPGADHFGIYNGTSGSCDKCHDQDWSGDNCTRCHDPSFTAGAVGDYTAPVTTSDALPSTVGATTVHLTATDAGSGVSQTWYSIDGSDWTQGTEVYGTAPRTGTRSHTLSFYSVDHARNAEAVKSVTFDVQAVPDTTPPVTTSNFNPAEGAVFNKVMVATLTATDGGSGVKSIHMAVDGGAFLYGQVYSFTEGLHWFSWYSDDWQGNVEATHTSNHFRIDTLAPVTSCSAISGNTYVGTQTFTLSAADAGSGVASTYYKLDAGAFVSGTSVTVTAPATGTASHTISWYSKDVATNQEATKSVTFTVTTSDATPPATTSSFNPAANAIFNTIPTVTLSATDAASGVKATWWRIDAGAWTSGTTFTVPEGVHTFSWYSVDNANNIETTHVSNSFRVDVTAPVTTSNLTAGSIYQGAKTATLSVTETGSGVQSTFYKLDAAGFVSGTSLTIPAPASGAVAHTLTWYSTDLANNVEAQKTVSFSVTVTGDVTAPVTTASLAPAAGAVTKVAAVTLTPTDAASGVKATYWRIDAGGFSSGTSFTVPEGLHTFSWYSVDNAGNTEVTHVSNQYRTDTIAPVTTSNLVDGTTYTGNKSVTLSPSDGGSGVQATYYKLDGGSFVSGTSVTVTAPASGTATHTLSWYSTDVATNVEATKTVTFYVKATTGDVTAPVTTSSFNPAAGAVFKTGQAVTLTASDASGVKSTYYKIDAGAFTQGTSFTVTGDGLHTFSWYSVDNVNNVEATHVSNSFRIDDTAPVTTADVTNGATLVGARTITLTPSDAGSGVLATYYKLDTGSFVAGNSVLVVGPASGSASHVLSWYSTDAAGNQEATQSVSFTLVAGTGPTKLSFRTNCTGYPEYGWVYFAVLDAGGTTIQEWALQGCTPGMEWDALVPAGAAYTLYGEIDEELGGYVDSATRAVLPAEAAPGATVEWWFH